MAVYTDISETELGAFLAHYAIGGLLSYKGIAEGVENSNYLLRTDNGMFILTLYEKRVDRNDLPFFLDLMRHLSGRGVNCPLPVPQASGELVGELAGRPAAIVTFLEGMWMRRPTVEHCRALGSALARLHLAGLDFQGRRANALGVGAWRPLWQLSRARADEVEEGLASETEADLELLEQHWPHGLPAGVIHADLFPDNVFFLKGRLSGLIDFYFACTDILAYDLAICLNAWCFERDHSFNLTKGRALLRAYADARALSPGEAAALPVLAHGAAMRFMLTRLYDWLVVPDGSFVVKKDPMEYVRRMRFHRGVKSAAEYGLVE
jgi:homoserine kinase type II